ncbi:hydroxypyruvate reductase [Humidesulfovibrio mexicanus]|uniref:Hydroxypyruvate reductase n=1 Tax=Humidesulfovibrio mexicanus TaxID=147047 RepID=A0A239BH54_9BACT|nr:glycerate kinase [Humidesulfovibrio mexicanus]SNS06741.1 hydroxypyruvate reductase [Humidesulfovibrio mexicanus]
MRDEPQFSTLRAIFEAALERIDPYGMITERVRLEGGRLVVQLDQARHEEELSRYSRVLVLGCGKASARMALALEGILSGLPEGLEWGGLVCTKYGHTERLARIGQVEAAHPVPDQAGVEAARRMAELARQADENTLVLNLISGGGSALLPAPMRYSDAGREVALTLEHKQAVTRALLSCGADIREINCVRKHLSELKGGRFLRLLAPARSISLILSDVVGDRLDTIASGITSDDSSTYAQALEIVRGYGIAGRIPQQALRALELGAAGEIPETPKPGDPALERAVNLLIGTNHAALLAACHKARELGLNVAPLTCLLTGEAREVARFLSGIGQDARRTGMLVAPPACVILGGETVVTLTGEGKGGRNQEMALAFLAELDRDPEAGRGLAFLSASTDGSDGPTDAAGAYASAGMLARAKEAGLSMSQALRANDSYHFFEAIGGLYKTGPTRTNVCDLHLLLVE